MSKCLANSRLTEIAAVMLGVALTLAFAPYQIFPLAIFALAGLLILINDKSARRAAWLGFTFGIGLFGSGVYWIYISIHQYGDAPIWLASLITIALVAVLALFPASTCYLTNRFFPTTNSARLIYAFPAVWLFSEWFRSWVGCGFPWLFLGYSQTNSPLKGYAPILSVYGVSLAILMSSGLLVNVMLAYKQKRFRSIYLSLSAIVAIWVVGGLLSLIPWTNPTGKPMTISLVQGNIPQSIKWSPEHIDLSFKRYSELTEPRWGKSEIIVWPEAAIPMSLQDASEFIDAMDKKALAHHSTLILGIPIQNPNGKGYYNAVVTLGVNKATYLKRRLVPYGEYVPFQELSSRVLSFMDVPMADMLAGKSEQTPLRIDQMKINTSICFEITFPELIYMRDKNIGLLLTVTNDAWFGDSSAQAQHLQMAQMRAIELGRPLIFSSNDGITAIIDPHGNIAAAAPTHTPYVLNSTVQAMTGLTPWMTNGIDPILVVMLVFLFTAYRSERNARASLQTSTVVTSKIN